VTPSPSAKPEALKACPFCGATAVAVRLRTDNWHVECTALVCGATIGSGWASRSYAVEAWNRRATTPKETP
jgi:Lar family restriction alleviation protein